MAVGSLSHVQTCFCTAWLRCTLLIETVFSRSPLRLMSLGTSTSLYRISQVVIPSVESAGMGRSIMVNSASTPLAVAMLVPLWTWSFRQIIADPSRLGVPARARLPAAGPHTAPAW